ncbi:hypothetical protein DFH06DRAFT_1122715 [Mycena polygramma]|nr:hypothetical protein DFH06DRAFT_1122715 [Mycena polygramma]
MRFVILSFARGRPFDSISALLFAPHAVGLAASASTTQWALAASAKAPRQRSGSGVENPSCPGRRPQQSVPSIAITTRYMPRQKIESAGRESSLENVSPLGSDSQIPVRQLA